MNYKSSELHFKRGNILFRMGHYYEALKAFEDALRIKVDHQYYYNRAVALQRLGQFLYAERALQQAIDCLKGSSEKTAEDDIKKYKRYMLNLRSREKPLIWWEWWFSEGTKRRRLCGYFLCIALFLAVVVPLVIVPVGIWLQWLCIEQWVEWGKWWVWYLIPIVIIFVLLLSPGIRSIGTQGLEMDQAMLRREEVSLEPIEKPVRPSMIEE